MKNRVTGIGGVFFKSPNPNRLKEWYANHLGINIDSYGTTFKNKENTYIVWSPMEENTTYYEPSKASFMINYTVENIEELIPILKEEGVEVVGEIQTFDYGKFAHIMDCDGNKVELWEPTQAE